MDIYAASLVFDFDGVLLDSVHLKTKAFSLWMPTSDPMVRENFMHYHRRAYGTSRGKQIRHYFEQILQISTTEELLAQEIDRFGKINDELIANAKLFPGVMDMLSRHRGAGIKMFVVSGTPEAELKRLAKKLDVACFFEEIIGSPETKIDALERLQREGKIDRHTTVFFGDADADYRASAQFGCAFVYHPSEAIFEACENISTISDFSTLNVKKI